MSIRNKNNNENAKELKFSLSMLAEKYRLNRADLLEYLVQNGLVSDIRTITDKGFKNGIEYRFSDDGNAKWPVYGRIVQDLISKEYNVLPQNTEVYVSTLENYDDIINKICEYVCNNENVLVSRKKIYSTFLDFFRGDQITVRRLLKGFDLGIIEYINSRNGDEDINKSIFISRLIKNDDLLYKRAVEIYDFWNRTIEIINSLKSKRSEIESKRIFDAKNEKDLVKKLKDEDDVFIEEDDDDKDPEEPKDEDVIDVDEFDEVEDMVSSQGDIFEGVRLDDPVRMYLKEIGQYSLLSIEREKRLAKEKQDAQVLLRKKKLDEQLPIDAARTIKLNDEELKIVKRGELAQEILIKCNLRLVVSIAKRYIGHGLSFLDLIQEGNLGLTRGIEKFDYKMGFKLSTYVIWWIRQAVSRALANQSKTIRMPVHIVETIERLNEEKNKLTEELEYVPSINQLAKAMKMTEEKVEEVTKIAKTMSMDIISLDEPVVDEDGSIVADFVSEDSVTPECYEVMIPDYIKKAFHPDIEIEKENLQKKSKRYVQ